MAKRLETRCISLGINSYIQELPDTGSWISNTRLKSKFVYDTLEQLKSPILWIDSDSTILKYPEIDLSYDCGAVRTPLGHDKTWYVGVLFFNYTDKGREFAKLWSESSIEGSDHIAFEQTYREWDKSGKFLELPKTYTELKKVTSETVISVGLSKDPSKMKYFKHFNHQAEKDYWKSQNKD
jgi:hypothetical protein